MKQIVLITLIGLFFSCTAQEKKELNNTFYAFNNAVRTLPNAPKGVEAQSEFIKRIGFDGFGGHTSEDYFKRRAAMDKVGLKMPEIYWGMTLTEKDKLEYNKKEIHKIIKDSKDRDLIVALFLNAKHYQNDQETGDPFIVKGLQELADFAASYNVKVAVYPHVTNYCETVEHSVRLAKLADRDNVGAIFNTCHLMKVEGEEGWEKKLVEAMPYLYMISISGTDSGDTKNMGWDKLIQPLGEGSFDTYQIVKLAKDNGYKGPFGLQCYNIKQDCEKALTKSVATWREYQKKYAEEK